jgi:hypothetical protein
VGASQVQAGNVPSAAALEAFAAVLLEAAAGASAKFPALLEDLMQQGSASNQTENPDDKKPEHKKDDKNESALLCLPIAVAELPVIPVALSASAPGTGVPQSAITVDSETVPLPDAAQPAPPELERSEAAALPEDKPIGTSTGKEPEAGAMAASDGGLMVLAVPPTILAVSGPDASASPASPAVTDPSTPDRKGPAESLVRPPVSKATDAKRTAESLPEMARANREPADQSAAAGPPRMSDAVRRPVEAPRPVTAVDAPALAEQRTPVLAFTARLTRLETQQKDTPASVASTPASPQPVEPVASASGSADAGAADREPPHAGTAALSAVRVSPAVGRETKSAEDPLPDSGASGTAISSAPQSFDAPTARRERVSPPAEPHRTPASAPEPAPAVSPARDIRLQVTGGERRVDVRLTERAGQVQVSVRTPDSQLAGALRDDLPSLSARLEQSGFRAETWHPAGARTEPLGAANDSSPSGSSAQQQPPGGQGRQQQHEPPPRRAPQPETNTGGDSAPPEFSRLFSSLP